MRKLFASLTISSVALSVMAGDIHIAPIDVTSGELQRVVMWSPQLADSVTIDIWTPPGYDTSKRYPVLYMHDGQNLFDAASTWNKQAWEIDSAGGALIEAGEIEPFICVGVHSTPEIRVSQLMPVAMLAYSSIAPLSTELYAHTDGHLRGDAYLGFMADTLKPYIDARFSTKTDAASTSVMGSSMGGLMSLYAICQRPATFGAAACLSTHIATAPANDPFAPAVTAYMRDHLPDATSHRLYFDTGTETIDAAYIPYFPLLEATAVEAGYSSPSSLSTKVYPGHAHEERSWAHRVSDPLKFIFGKK